MFHLKGRPPANGGSPRLTRVNRPVKSAVLSTMGGHANWCLSTIIVSPRIVEGSENLSEVPNHKDTLEGHEDCNLPSKHFIVAVERTAMTEKLPPAVHRIDCGRVNVYLVEDDDALTLVDAGLPGCGDAIRTAVRAQGYTIRDLDRVCSRTMMSITWVRSPNSRRHSTPRWSPVGRRRRW